MFKFDVVEINHGCGCCSYITVQSFNTLEEAEAYAKDDPNLIIEPDYYLDEEEDSYEEEPKI